MLLRLVLGLLSLLCGPAFAQTTTCTGDCTLTFVVDLSALDILNIDPAGGASIAGAVLAVWAFGWGVRMVIRALNSDSVSSESEG